MATAFPKRTLHKQNSLVPSEDTALSIHDDALSVATKLQKVELRLTAEEIALVRLLWLHNVVDQAMEEEFNAEHPEIAAAAAQVAAAAEASASGELVVRPSLTMFASVYFWRQVYETLLEQHPELEKVLPLITHQTTSFAGIMYTAVNNLEDLSTMDEFLGNLGRRHGRVFNVKPAYFEAMGVALIETFVDRYKELFTQEISVLWARLYCFLANLLIQALHFDPVLSQDLVKFPELLRGTWGPNSSVGTAETPGAAATSVVLPINLLSPMEFLPLPRLPDEGSSVVHLPSDAFEQESMRENRAQRTVRSAVAGGRQVAAGQSNKLASFATKLFRSKGESVQPSLASIAGK